MTTKLGMENSELPLVEEQPSSIYKQRRLVQHEDGPNPTFWNDAYFIPGITGRARCLQVDENDGVADKSKSVTKRRTSNESSAGVESCTSRESSKDMRSWCTPSALRRASSSSQKESPARKRGKEKSTRTGEKMPQENCDGKVGSFKFERDNESNRTGWSSLPDVLHSKQIPSGEKENSENLKYQRRCSSEDFELQQVEQDLEKLLQEFRDNREQQQQQQQQQQ